jgi:hypothetical protein
MAAFSVFVLGFATSLMVFVVHADGIALARSLYVNAVPWQAYYLYLHPFVNKRYAVAQGYGIVNRLRFAYGYRFGYFRAASGYK